MLCQVAGELEIGRGSRPRPSRSAGGGSTIGFHPAPPEGSPGRPGPPEVLRLRSRVTPTRSENVTARLRPSYPQDAQRAVEMLIIQRSQIAAFSGSQPLAGCPRRPYIPSCAEHGAGVGRSSTGRSYETARKGRSGKSTGVVDETATGSANFFGPKRSLRRHDFRLV